MQTKEQKEAIVFGASDGHMLEFTMDGRNRRMLFIKVFAMHSEIPRSKDKKHHDSGFYAREDGRFKTCCLSKVTNLRNHGSASAASVEEALGSKELPSDSCHSCETHFALMSAHVGSC